MPESEHNQQTSLRLQSTKDRKPSLNDHFECISK